MLRATFCVFFFFNDFSNTFFAFLKSTQLPVLKSPDLLRVRNGTIGNSKTPTRRPKNWQTFFITYYKCICTSYTLFLFAFKTSNSI